MGKQSKSRGELKEKEVHPEASNALGFVLDLGVQRLAMYQEAFSSCAIEGNRLGEICGETLRRMMVGQPVSDRYILGLAWAIKRMEGITAKEAKGIHKKNKLLISKKVIKILKKRKVLVSKPKKQRN